MWHRNKTKQKLKQDIGWLFKFCRNYYAEDTAYVMCRNAELCRMVRALKAQSGCSPATVRYAPVRHVTSYGSIWFKILLILSKFSALYSCQIWQFISKLSVGSLTAPHLIWFQILLICRNFQRCRAAKFGKLSPSYLWGRWQHVTEDHRIGDCFVIAEDMCSNKCPFNCRYIINVIILQPCVNCEEVLNQTPTSCCSSDTGNEPTSNPVDCSQQASFSVVCCICMYYYSRLFCRLTNAVQTHTLHFNGHFSRWTWVSRLPSEFSSIYSWTVHPMGSGTGLNFPCHS